jgi:hypothetical protein
VREVVRQLPLLFCPCRPACLPHPADTTDTTHTERHMERVAMSLALTVYVFSCVSYVYCVRCVVWRVLRSSLCCLLLPSAALCPCASPVSHASSLLSTGCGDGVIQ